MAVIQVKKYKIKKDENGNRIQVPKPKEEWNKETCNGTKTWYFYERYELNGKKVPYHSAQFELKRQAEDECRLFLNNPVEYIHNHSKRARNNIEIIKPIDLSQKTLNDYYDKDYFEYDMKINREGTAYDHKNNYFKHISPILGNDIPSEINISRIDYFHKEIEKKGLAHSTNVNINSSLSKFMDYLVKKGIIEINYSKAYGTFTKKNDEVIQIEKDIKYQTLEEYNVFANNINDIFWNAFYNFLFWHGLRKGEQQAITWKDIDFDKELVIINKTVAKNKNGGIKINNVKNEKFRIIYLAKQSIEPLKELYNLMSNLSGFNDNWYVFGRGQELTDIVARNTIDRHIKLDYTNLQKLFPDKNILRLTHHEFGRHSHASYLLNIGLEKGLPLDEIINIIAQRLGDTDEVIKSTYAHPYESVKTEKIKELLNF